MNFRGLMLKSAAFGALAALMISAQTVAADVSAEPQEHGANQQEFVHGAPQLPSLEWTLAAGGRIYDNWWEALDRPAPEAINPAYPVSAEQKGTGTWRCKECHGWDYLGAEGIYRQGSHFTGIKGVMGMRGRPAESLMATLRDGNHPYTPEMITDEEMLRVATFISEGLTDMRAFIDYETRTVIPGAGDFTRGRAIFQTTCAACHGFDGRAMDWGEGDAHNFVGTEATELPDEVYNKISNAHPGAAMINMRAFSVQDRVSLLTYIATLPVDIDK
uniref:c-type cytochrome n=1 Tax=Roseovarius sp. BRH_c41 TaxID=1629709 RepID=UPI0005F1C993|nr:cytochrome c [Roseovarius sp. BRH_c41]